MYTIEVTKVMLQEGGSPSPGRRWPLATTFDALVRGGLRGIRTSLFQPLSLYPLFLRHTRQHITTVPNTRGTMPIDYSLDRTLVDYKYN